MSTLYDFVADSLEGVAVPLERYRGRVALVVNVASRCGFTPQYAGLEALHRKYRDCGLSVLGFPCNQFRDQEPGSAAEIRNFCSTHYAVGFDLFAKLEVNGAHAHPLYRWLKTEAPGILGTGAIKWNFTKFLVDRGGRVVRRFAPNTKPEKLEADLERLLGSP